MADYAAWSLITVSVPISKSQEYAMLYNCVEQASRTELSVHLEQKGIAIRFYSLTQVNTTFTPHHSHT